MDYIVRQGRSRPLEYIFLTVISPHRDSYAQNDMISQQTEVEGDPLGLYYLMGMRASPWSGLYAFIVSLCNSVATPSPVHLIVCLPVPLSQTMSEGDDVRELVCMLTLG